MPSIYKSPTVKDVAKAAGVTAATVSNVLRGKLTEVSEATAERVLEKVQELGYVRNLTASSLSSRTSNTIALIMIGVFDLAVSKEDMEPNPFYGELAIRMEREAREKGFALNIYAGEEDGYEEFVLQRNIDAAILCGVTPRDNPGSIMKRKDLRLLLFDSCVDHPQHLSVCTNEPLGGRIAAEHLLETGRRKLTFVGPPLSHDPSNVPALRYYGAKAACKEAGIELGFLEAWTHLSNGIAAGEQLAETDTEGIIASSDVLAAGILQGLLRKGRKVPEDIALIGYDNLPFCQMLYPALTTIDQQLPKKIEYALDLIMNGTPGEHRTVKPTLVKRQTT